MSNWSIVPADAANTWIPENPHSYAPAEPFVARVRELLASGFYMHIVAVDGVMSFTGTEAECVTYLAARGEYLPSREASPPPELAADPPAVAWR